MKNRDSMEAPDTSVSMATREPVTGEEQEHRFAFAHLRHELRTPLNQIIGYSDLLIEDAEEKKQESLASDLRRINSAGLHVLDLINNIIDLSRARVGARLDTGSKAGSSTGAETARASEQPATAETPTGSVLVVDDEEANRDMLRRRLERQGCKVALAPNGKKALDSLRANPCDLVLLDLLMPEMDGFEVLAQLKDDNELRHIPVIVISALDDLESVVRCIEMGADDYLPKPFNPVLLRARVGACLEKKHLRDQEQRLYHELEENYAALRALERLRDDLTHMIVHDLRQPMTSFISGLQLLEVVGPLNEQQSECLGMATAGGQMLLAMVSDLLDVGKMEAGAMVLLQQNIEVKNLAAEAISQINWLAKEKNITLDHVISPEARTIRGDTEKLRRSLVNLLGNAVKYTPEGGTITLASRRDEDQVILSVYDTGEGIPKEAFDRIFEKFGQVQLRKEGQMLSTGLGLTFCKMVAEAHGGRIWVESEFGRGSAFHLALPAQ